MTNTTTTTNTTKMDRMPIWRPAPTRAPASGSARRPGRTTRPARRAERRTGPDGLEGLIPSLPLCVGAAALIFVSGILLGRSEQTRDYTANGQLIPACAVGRQVQEDEIRYDFVGGVGATIRCVQP